MTDRRLAVDAWESLFRAQHEVFAEISADFDEDNLSQSEYDVLLTVTRAPRMTARLRDVTRLALVSQPSVSRLVDRMVARGLVTKCADPEDGRGALVTATDDGARAFRDIARRHAATVAERMTVLSDDELLQLRDLTAKLRRLDPACVEVGDIAGAGPEVMAPDYAARIDGAA
jgi:DNA-binding MarR family transcriptional regulator